MKISLLLFGFLIAPVVQGGKTILLNTNKLENGSKQTDIVKGGNSEGSSTNVPHKPYLFTDCMSDFKHVFLSLVNDVNDMNGYSIDDQLNNQSVKTAPFLSHKTSQKEENFTYNFVSFTTQALNICLLDSLKEILPQVLLELKKSKYPKTCVVSGTKINSKGKDDCFDLLQSFTSRMKVNKLDSNVNKNRKAKDTENFLEDYENQQFKKNVISQFKVLPILTSTTSNSPKSKKNTFWATKVETKVVTNKPSMALKYSTITKQLVATEVKQKNNVRQLTTNGKHSLLMSAIPNKLLGAEVALAVAYDNKSQRSSSNDVDALVFNIFSRFATSSGITPTTTSSQIRPIRSIICNGITILGLFCPFRTATLSTVIATENVNININVNENKGNIKFLRNTATNTSQNQKTLTTVVTQTKCVTTTKTTTSTKNITKLTTLTKTVKTTKTKYKIITQTKTKNIHDCDDESHDHNIISEDNYFEDDLTDYSIENNETSAEEETDGSNEYDESNEIDKENDGDNENSEEDILIIQLAANSPNYKYPLNSAKRNDSKYIENPRLNNNTKFNPFTNQLKFDNAASINLPIENYFTVLSIMLLSVPLFL